MNEEDFRQRCPQSGDILHAHLDIWKSGKHSSGEGGGVAGSNPGAGLYPAQIRLSSGGVAGSNPGAGLYPAQIRLSSGGLQVQTPAQAFIQPRSGSALGGCRFKPRRRPVSSPDQAQPWGGCRFKPRHRPVSSPDQVASPLLLSAKCLIYVFNVSASKLTLFFLFLSLSFSSFSCVDEITVYDRRQQN